MIKTMKIEDYDKVRALWDSIKGFGIRSLDDSYDGVKRFLERNPTTSIVAEEDGKIIGSILCGHDGRRGCFYHVCVKEGYRKHGVGNQMALAAIQALKEEKINKVSLVAFKKNEVGNTFWKELGWDIREDLNYYELTLDASNTTKFV